jgi:hypothetical protein
MHIGILWQVPILHMSVVRGSTSEPRPCILLFNRLSYFINESLMLGLIVVIRVLNIASILQCLFTIHIYLKTAVKRLMRSLSPTFIDS